ncbi:IS5 family transposase [Pseudovibrio sp. Tun.PSC04-5.I4]|uniref:IS5 family transposase n=1 Tax=Pseudovibrio sp. Tun.PSC04-5.I4 TaxID=1798213 RepID=UPI0008835E4A|nr:IS5 family transposase [Pseudovibrio sp. Tun.PSC04-5.I4]SDR48815.1 Transposase DDE domain-containing protein [Pseudovibrio sp. Tun.PSC04-5.I4]
MPHKYNASQRHKFAKPGYRVTNWSDYNESLRQRADVSVWISHDVAQSWSASKRTTRGGQPQYSALAIEVCLTARAVFGLALRQTQGFLRSVFRLMKLDLPVPDFSTLSRRAGNLQLSNIKSKIGKEPVHLVVDSTGLKIFGAGEWQETKHGTRIKRRSWRKLHLGRDLNTGEILCSELTEESVGDPTTLPELLGQVEGPVARFLGDGAYVNAESNFPTCAGRKVLSLSIW